MTTFQLVSFFPPRLDWVCSHSCVDSTGEKNGPTTSASLSLRMNFVVLIVAFAGISCGPSSWFIVNVYQRTGLTTAPSLVSTAEISVPENVASVVTLPDAVLYVTLMVKVTACGNTRPIK